MAPQWAERVRKAEEGATRAGATTTTEQASRLKTPGGPHLAARGLRAAHSSPTLLCSRNASSLWLFVEGWPPNYCHHLNLFTSSSNSAWQNQDPIPLAQPQYFIRQCAWKQIKYTYFLHDKIIKGNAFILLWRGFTTQVKKKKKEKISLV